MNQLIKNQSLDGFRRITKSIKNLESNQSHPLLTVEAVVSTPPTTSEINSAFDTPSNIGTDFVGLIVDTTNNNQWLVWTDGTTWYVISKAGSSVGIGARVYNNASISIPTGTTTELTYNSERFDTSNFHSTISSTGRFTIPTTGIYVVSAHATFAANTTGERTLNLGLLTATLSSLTVPATSNLANMSISTIYRFTAGDILTTTVFQNSGGPLNIVLGPNFSPEFAIAKIG